jgi:hypothetical protein
VIKICFAGCAQPLASSASGLESAIERRTNPAPGALAYRRGGLHRRPYQWSAPGRTKSAGKEGAQGWGPRKPQTLVIFDNSRIFGAPCADDCRCYTARPSRSES